MRMKFLKIFGIILGVCIAISMVGLVIFGMNTPETSVYYGRQLPKRYLNEIRELGLLEKEEQIVYFYSDALLDIKNGMYFVSDQHLVIYCQDWEEPATILNFEDLTKIEVEYSDSFFEDSYVVVESASGFEISFPISSEKGMDKKFVEHIESKMPSTGDAIEQVDVTPRPKR